MKQLKLTDEQIATKELVESCIKVGWTWTEPFEGIQLLTPPKGDKRINWCAMWMPYLGNPNRRIPHRANPNTVK